MVIGSRLLLLMLLDTDNDKARKQTVTNLIKILVSRRKNLRHGPARTAEFAPPKKAGEGPSEDSDD